MIHSYLLFISIFFTIINYSKQGTIKPGKNPIQNTIANRDQFADYTFQLIPQTTVPKGGILQITFPSQYSGLGIPTVTASTCSITCTIVGNILTFSFTDEILANIQIEVTVYQVKNPSITGGTGSFYLRTYQGVNLFDENLIFGELGVAGNIFTLTSTSITIDSSGTFAAGEPTKYNLAFKTEQIIPVNSYIEFWIPSIAGNYLSSNNPLDYEISSNPSCATYPINNVEIDAQIKCSKIDNKQIIRIDGLLSDIQAGSDIGISVSVINPKVSLFTDQAYNNQKFRIVVFRSGTKVVYGWSNPINGFQITPGRMQYVQFYKKLQSAVESKSKVMDYYLKILPKNSLPNNSVLEIKLPTSISIYPQTETASLKNSFQVISGLDDLSATSPLKDTYVNADNSILISNFAQQLVPQEITMFLRIQLPKLPGKTNAIIITTYTDSTKTIIIDRDSTQASTIVQDINSQDTSYLATTNQNNYKYQANSSIQLFFKFTPTSLLVEGTIYQITFPDEMTVNQISAPNLCTISQLSIVDQPSNRCKKQDQIVRFYQKTGTTLAPNNLANGVEVTMKFFSPGATPLTFLSTPVFEGVFLIDIAIFKPDGQTLVESSSFMIVVYPEYLNFINAQVLMNFNNPGLPPQKYRSGILEIELNTLTLQLIDGKPKNKPTDPQGYIDIVFVQNYVQLDNPTLYPLNSSISCKNIEGIFPLDNEKIECTFISGLYYDPKVTDISATYKIIRMKNFKQINKNSLIKFHIVDVLNPEVGNGQICVLLKMKDNRREKILALSQVLPITYNAIAADVAQSFLNDDYIKFFPSLPQQQEWFSIIFFVTSSIKLFVGDKMIIKFSNVQDLGYFPDNESLTCEITLDQVTNISDPYNLSTVSYIQQLTIYKDLNWVLMEITNAPQLAACGTCGPGDCSCITGSNISVIIKNLIWPRYFFKFNNLIQIYLPSKIVPDSKNIMYVAPNTLINVGKKDFISAQILTPFKAPNKPGASVEIVCVTSVDHPDGFKIRLTFDPNYLLQSSNPSPFCDVPQLKPAVGHNSITQTFVSQNVVEFTNIGFHPKNAPFRIVCQGIKNPNSTPNTASTGWKIESYMGTYDTVNAIPTTQIINKYDIPSFNFGDKFQPSIIIFQGIYAFPRNAGQNAKYTVSFYPSYAFLKNSIITIGFPAADYPVLPNSPQCSLSGGLTTFQSCTYQGIASGLNIYKIITDTAYNSGVVNFSVENVMNPSTPNKLTGGFVVEISYDGIIIDSTDKASVDPFYLSKRVLKTAPTSTPLQQCSVQKFIPKNEAEKSIYTFQILPQNALTISSILYIEFPKNFDQLLGRETIQCQAVQGLNKEIGCSVKNRVITLYGITAYTPSIANPIILNILGIINPNRQSTTPTGFFKIGTYNQYTDYFIDYLTNVPADDTLSASTWLNLKSLIPTNQFIRVNADYSMTFTVGGNTNKLPSTVNKGQILIQYPPQYDILYSEQGLCDSVSISNKLSCTYSKYSLNEVQIDGQDEIQNQEISLTVRNIQNPVEQGEIDSIVIKTFDGQSMNIIQKTFLNLDPTNLNFIVPGPLITVNGNQTIILESGTVTQPIKVSVDYPCAQNLTLTVKFSQDGIVMIPDTLKLNVGDLFTQFQITVPNTYNAGNYFIYWSIQVETYPGEKQEQLLYTLIKKTQIQITQNKNVRIDVSTLQEIPKNGWSLPTLVKTDYAPNKDVIVTLKFDKAYQGLTLSTNQLVFSNKVNELYFYVNCTADSTVEKGTILLGLGGTNIKEYALSRSTIDFKIIDQITENPLVTDLINTENYQTRIQLTIGASEISQVFFMLALRGTNVPLIEDVLYQNKPPTTTTRSVYGNVIIGKTNKESMYLANLEAQVMYVVYAYAVNRGGKWSDLKTFEFQTKQRDPAAEFTLKFNQVYLNSAEKDAIKRAIAFVLSLRYYQVIEKKYTFASTTRVLAEEQTTYITLQIFSNPLSENFGPPLQIIEYLKNSQINNLAKRINNLDVKYQIPSANFIPYDVGLLEDPSMVDTKTKEVTIQFSLNNYGWVFVTAAQTNLDKGKPKNQQIYWGYNSTNYVVPSNKLEIEKPYQKYNLTITNLEENTQYNVYMVIGTVHPGYPDLVSDDNIKLVDIKTFFVPKVPKLDLYGSLFQFLQIYLLFMFLSLI